LQTRGTRQRSYSSVLRTAEMDSFADHLVMRDLRMDRPCWILKQWIPMWRGEEVCGEVG